MNISDGMDVSTNSAAAPPWPRPDRFKNLATTSGGTKQFASNCVFTNLHNDQMGFSESLSFF